MASPGSISRRKADHLAVAASGKADFRDRSTLLEQVNLIHQALPELATSEIDLSCSLFGRTLSAPLVITGMTGGTEAAGQINRDLAQCAEELGIAFGLGSQRAMAVDPDQASTFQVKEAAPNVVLIGNLGAVQAREMGAQKVAELAASVGADAMAIHLNPGQELIQDHGDRDFRSLVPTIQELVATLPIPLVVKETGCGISAQVAESLVTAGVQTVDVSGAGGTSWVAVETQRAAENSPAQSLGSELWDWGIPTAVSVVACSRAQLTNIASGGLRTGYDVARALALGARAGGMAAPVLRAHQTGGKDGALVFLRSVISSISAVALLCGCKRAQDLATAPRVLGPTLKGWLDDLGLR